MVNDKKVCTKFPIFDRVTGADIGVRRLVFAFPLHVSQDRSVEISNKRRM